MPKTNTPLSFTEMDSFLRNEGWTRRRFHWYGTLSWVDPLNGALYDSTDEGILKAYRRAQKRLRARETATLKNGGRMGNFISNGKNRWTFNAHSPNLGQYYKTRVFTRAEALAELGFMEDE